MGIISLFKTDKEASQSPLRIFIILSHISKSNILTIHMKLSNNTITAIIKNIVCLAIKTKCKANIWRPMTVITTSQYRTSNMDIHYINEKS